MLVLTTKMEDGVQIGDDIRITIVDVRPRNVRLGIEAPRSVSIKRDPAAMQRRNVALAVSSPGSATASETMTLSTLIVCRDQPLLNRLNSALEQGGTISESLVAPSMTDAKRRIEAHQRDSRPIMLLLDIDLSPQTAIVFLRWLRRSESRREIPVVVMRGEQTPHTNASLLTAGANVVVNKDQPWNRVSRCIQSATELWRCCKSPDEMRAPSLNGAVA